MADNTTEIQCTKDYSVFKWHKEQRALKPLKVNRMMNSMQKRGFLPSKPIEVNDNFEIMDGQHRFQAAKNLGLPIYFIPVKDITVEDVREMGRESNKWDLEDYVTSYIRQGEEAYIELMNWKKRLNLTFSKLFRTGILYQHGINLDSVRSQIYNGTLSLSAEGKKRVAAFEAHYNEIKALPEVNKKVTAQIDFIGALAYVISYEGYDHKTMMKRLEYQQTRLVKCPDTASYVELLSSIYNYNAHKQNIIDFKYPSNNYLRRKGK